MFEIVLFQPEIPPNTGNIIRLCANTGMRLHLVRPLGFRLDARTLRRAGLDYHELADVRVHPHWQGCLDAIADARLFALTTRAATPYDRPAYRAGDAFVFGSETAGLPDGILDALTPEQRLRIPMRSGSRSLNLANAVAVVAFEAWRQLHFSGGG